MGGPLQPGGVSCGETDPQPSPEDVLLDIEGIGQAQALGCAAEVEAIYFLWWLASADRAVSGGLGCFERLFLQRACSMERGR